MLCCCLQVKKKEMKIFELRKKIAESDKDLKQQQNLYEAARSDRNLYSKNLIEAQDEIAEFKRKIKIMTHQVTSGTNCGTNYLISGGTEPLETQL